MRLPLGALALLALATLAARVEARQGTDGAASGGRSAPRESAARKLEARSPRFDTELWRERLCAPDLDLREAAFAELVRELRRSREGLPVLEAWAASQERPELSWTARLALREARRAPEVLVLADPRYAAPGPRPGVAIDLSHPLLLDQGLRSLAGLAPPAFEGEAGLSLYAPRLVSFQGPPTGQARIYNLELGPGAVTLRITEAQGGRVHTHEHSAPSLQLLLEQNPRLGDEVPGLRDMAVRLPVAPDSLASGGHLRWSGGPVRLRVDPHGWRAEPPTLRLSGIELGGEDPPTRILGIECQPLTDEECERRALEPGVGLRVERTIPGTLAHEMELRRGDILVRIDEREMRRCEDIGTALAEREADRPLVLGLVDTDGQARTITWRPPSDR